MTRRTSSVCALAIVAVALSFAQPVQGQTRRAVLVGINTYVSPAPAEQGAEKDRGRGRPRGAFANLHGALNDVDAVRAVLIGRFAFKPENVHVLVERAATRSQILAAVRKWLIEDGVAGDVSFFFYAGHGSQVRNTRSLEPDKLDESIVAADASAGASDIRDKEIAQLFGQALDKQILLTVAFDSCHSGSISRGPFRAVRVRAIAPDPRDAADPISPPSLESRGAVVMSAAQSHQLAQEITDEDGNDRGLFTWALVKTLQRMPANESIRRVFLSVRALMHSKDPSQDPDVSAPMQNVEAPLFGSDPAQGEVRIAVRSRLSGRTFTVEGGLAIGLRSGCELRLIGGNHATDAVLRVLHTEGMALSTVTLVSGDPATVTPGSLLEITRWSPADRRALRLWVGSSMDTPLIPQETGKLRDQLKGASVRWVADPSDEAVEGEPVVVVQWDGATWNMLAGGSSGTVLRSIVEPGRAQPDSPTQRRIFIDVPIAREIKAQIDEDTDASNGSIEIAHTPESADYMLVGRETRGALEYAWLRPLVGSNLGLSSLPIRTDWVLFDPRAPKTAALVLEQQMARLGVIKMWLDLEPPPNTIRIPYHLGLRTASGVDLAPSESVKDGETLGLVLTLDDALSHGHVSPQYVYVFIIDSAGAGHLLYPSDFAGGGGENFLPQRDQTGQSPREIPLGPHDLLHVEAPFGADTYVMLTTSTPLADPTVLEGRPVHTRDASRAPSDPLSQLLLQTAAGRRGPTPTTPADWAIERVIVKSVPRE